MKHHKKGRKFGREKGERKALLRGLAAALILHGKVKTTEAKAKELRPFMEQLLTKGRTGTLSARRLVIARLGGRTGEAKKLMDEIAPRYTTRPGGYTRITKISPRKSDASRMAIIEFV